ncbi:4-hydroxythreonine-4-phosphate dehydrogenase [Roseibium aquae]|uniref:4-hydroxythreonine-4-phosphate dehydrogenase n=1 Tax=Roseibium aquae TaxID=1323746 RepID=A0A916TI78_9HYPH|nr:4-hydroxythreonine-4-phosphate dehydrogenase PdxA [Roseibium aquae]GGB43084.1 4-hydroxythreonine-4-phosphate dehydrogenase [Roseibium aquae]
MVQLPVPLAVTCGEPAGIGPDLILTAFQNRAELGLPPFYVRTDPAFLKSRAQRLGISEDVAAVTPEEARATFARALPVVPTGDPIADTPGTEDPMSAASVVGSIRACVIDVKEGHASAVVTNPINKAALYKAGFTYPGHTEYLGALGSELWACTPCRPVMMIAGPELMVIPVTIHIPLKDVPGTLTGDLIVETARIADRDLKTRFGITRPRLALCGLNPHAGENGALGREDEEIILPAIDRLLAEGIEASGPFPADTLFHPEARKAYDCALGMYHDQVLVPAKTIGFDDAVNVTLGLPFIRTSPDHGTAYPLAGTGKARVDSFAAALRLAAVLANPKAV